jgi:hypothetical protein
MGVFWRGLPSFLVQKSSNLLGPNAVAIETGTYLGDSACLLGEEFKKCYTIELDAALAANAIRRFGSNPKVEVLHGTTREVLPKVLTEIDAPLFVWLDAHYSGGITAGEQDKCPVIAEINSIDMVRQSINTIVLIDDARGFLGQNEWPYLSDVVHAFEKGDWHVAAIDDVLIATSKNNLEVLLDDADKASRLFALERAAGQWQLLNIPLKTFSLLSRNRVLLVTRKLLFLLTTRVRRKN